MGGKKCGQIRGGGKSMGCKFNGKISVASKNPRQHWWQRKGKVALRAKAIATQVAKLWQKVVARARDCTRKWENTGKCRRHIAYPHDIVCSRCRAQTAFEIVLYAKQVTIFNQMVAASNDQT